MNLEKKSLTFGRALPMMVLIIVVTAASFSYYKRSNSFGNREKEPIKLLPEDIADSTQGLSFSQTDHGKTTFEFRAKSKLGLKDSKILLEYITVKVYGKEGDRHDTITSNRCEYDEVADEIVFLDNVVIEFGPLDKVLNPNKTDSPGEAPLRTTVKTDKIKYTKKSGVAQTEENATFVRGRVHGSSRGLTYDSVNGTLRLHSEVEIFVEPENIDDSLIQLRTDSLTYFKPNNVVQMRSNTWIRKAANDISADEVDAFLDTNDSTLTQINALGHVQSKSRDPKSMLEVDADRMTYFFAKGGHWLSKTIAEGNVRSHSLNEDVKRDLSSDRLEITLKPASDSIEMLKATGNVVAVLADKIVRAASPYEGSTPGPGDKVIKSPEIWAFFGSGARQVSRMEARGPSTLEDLPSLPTGDKRIVSALELTVLFEDGSNKIEKCIANREVRVNVVPAAGPVKRTSSDHLVALMDKQTHQINRFLQFGRFEYEEEGRRATSEEAEYFAQDKIVRLRGRPEVSDASSRTTAEVIELHNSQNLFKASGNVRSVSYNGDSGAKTAIFEAGSSVYASSEFMEAETNTGVARYWKKARLWQEDQVIRADTIYLYRAERKLVAERNVHSLFYLEKRKKGDESSEPQRDPVTIQAQRMVYEDSRQKAVYDQDIKMNSSMGVLNSDRLEVFLESKQNQTAVQRLRASGAVTVRQPGRTSFSDFADYFRDEDKLFLSGGPPRVIDSERGSTSGARLTMNLNDDSISVEGDPETRAITRRHVAR